MSSARELFIAEQKAIAKMNRRGKIEMKKQEQKYYADMKIYQDNLSNATPEYKTQCEIKLIQDVKNQYGEYIPKKPLTDIELIEQNRQKTQIYEEFYKNKVVKPENTQSKISEDIINIIPSITPKIVKIESVKNIPTDKLIIHSNSSVQSMVDDIRKDKQIIIDKMINTQIVKSKKNNSKQLR